jgi:hypothetical protein
MHVRCILFQITILLIAGCGSDTGGPATGTDIQLTDIESFSDEGSDAATIDAVCSLGESRCLGLDKREVCSDGEWIFYDECVPPKVCKEGECVLPAGCQPGAILGCLDEQTIKMCSVDGSGIEGIPCFPGQFCLNGICGDQLCIPGSRECVDTESYQFCNSEGSGFEAPVFCGEGSVCIQGDCISGCEADYKFGSYVGCEYWTVDLDQYEDPFGDPEPIPHAVVISNPGLSDANIVFESFSSVPMTVLGGLVPSGESVSFEMPRHDLDGSGIFNRSIRVRSDRPVLAAQFNPLNNVGVASNDGTLLLPKAALGKEYYVLSWPSGVELDFFEFTPQKGYFTVVAVTPGKTTVTIKFSALTEATLDAVANDVVVPLDSYPANSTQSFEMEWGQVLQVTAKPLSLFEGDNADLTGSHVSANKPIMVLGGHEEAVVKGYSSRASESCCAEHLEEQLLPVRALGKKVVCGKSAPRGNDPDLWRIVAVDDLTLSTDPPQVDFEGNPVTDVSLQAGEKMMLQTEDSFVLEATGRILVGQYLVSQEFTDQNTGDPALIHGIPVEQWRDDYPILTPAGYSQNWLTVMRVANAPVFLDDVVLDNAIFSPIGSSPYEAGFVEVTEGQHRVHGVEAFGLIEVGYSNAVSYGLAAGMNIKNLASP